MIRGAVLTTAVAGLYWEKEPELLTYNTYAEKFSKHVDNSRAAIFNENMKLIQLQNANPAKSWVAGPNEFTDWTNEEFKALRTSRAPIGPMGPVVVTEAKLSDLPSTVDWRQKKGVVTPPKNQGECGSCWAFSATETLESHFAIATGEDAPILAPQQIVSCAPNPRQCGGTGGCSGATQPIAFNYTAKAGLTTESNYPYEGVTGTCQPSKIQPVALNSGSVSLKVNDYTQLLSSVAIKGPIAISVAAGSMGWQFYFGGIFEGGLFGCGFEMDHAVQLVGYGAEGSKMYWLVRNSWGNWGEHGYIRIERFGEGKEPCGVDNDPASGGACKGDTTKPTYCGECGILSASSYPTNVRKAGGIVV